jgi:hypothetical protein
MYSGMTRLSFCIEVASRRAARVVAKMYRGSCFEAGGEGEKVSLEGKQSRTGERRRTEKDSTIPIRRKNQALKTTETTKAMVPSTVFDVPGQRVRPTSLPTMEAYSRMGQNAERGAGERRGRTKLSPIPSTRTPVKRLMPLPSSHSPPAHPVRR